MRKILFGLAVFGLVLNTQVSRADDLLAPDQPAASDNPAPSLGNTKDETPPPANGSSGATSSNTTTPATPPTAVGQPPKNDLNTTTPSSPEAQPSIPLTAMPGKTEGSPAAKAVSPEEKKDIYDEYYDYLDKEKERAKTEKDISMRTLFPHENGSWQVGLAYVRNAFGGYNFNRSATTPNPKMYANTQGANLLISWFPLHSLTFGRLGFGVTGGIYWSTFNTATPQLDSSGNAIGGTVTTKATPQEVTSYGGRAVYEFDYFLGQILVPFAFLGVDNVLIKNYSITVNTTSVVNVDARRILSQNYGGGLHLNLNRIEPVVASRALVNVGIRKFYLTYMALQRTGDLAGLTHNMALTFEF